jgi:hypothetical protein
VGEVFEVSCAGQSLELEEPFKIINPESQEYSVVYLKTINKTPNELTFLATSYASKTLQHPFLHIADAKGGGFVSQKIEIRSQSVIDPQNPPQNIYGPIQPMTLNWPYWIFFAGLLVFVVLLGWGGLFFRRVIQRKNLEKNIRKFQSPMGSYHQFSKDLRLLKRGVVFSDNVVWPESQTQSYLAKLDEIYRMFILREYTVPALTWPTAQIARHVFKKNKSGYKHFESAFLKAFKELERAQAHIADLKPRDCEQLTHYCWLAVDAMWKQRSSGGT